MVLVRKENGREFRYPYAYGMIILKVWYELMDGIHLVKNRDQWRALVDKVINYRVPLKAVGFLHQLSDRI
jgi:hypothetical protein